MGFITVLTLLMLPRKRSKRIIADEPTRHTSCTKKTSEESPGGVDIMEGSISGSVGESQFSWDCLIAFGEPTAQ